MWPIACGGGHRIPADSRNGVLARIEGRETSAVASCCVPTWMRCRSRRRPGLEYASRNKGVMHACGHDVHTACLLGAMLVLKRMSERIEGTVFGLFQPARSFARAERRSCWPRIRSVTTRSRLS